MVSLAGHLGEFPSEVVDALLPKIPVPMFIVPRSPDQQDYCILFRLDEVFESLRSGILVRPKLEAWAATDSGWDVGRLARELETEFHRQFQEEQERLVRAGKMDIKELEASVERKSREVSSSLGQAGSSLAKVPTQLGVAALSLNPLTGALTWPAGLIFLGLAANNASNVASHSAGYLEGRSMRNEVKRELREVEKDLEEVQEELDSKDQAFRQAVANLEVRVHPQLWELYRLMCDKEGTGWRPDSGGAVLDDGPDVQAYLANRDFVKKLPRRYRKLAASV
jgi:hypothetical protein